METSATAGRSGMAGAAVRLILAGRLS
jgi:hypothetical protein